MVKFSRYKTIAFLALLFVGICAVVVWFNRHNLSIAYHRRAMNSAYNELFGNPEPVGNGLASYDVTGIDVDAVMARYTHHRQRLVELGYFFYLSESLPCLSATPHQSASAQRSNFVERMWVKFPQHKHYCVLREDTFEVWDVVENESKWKAFLDAERNWDVAPQ